MTGASPEQTTPRQIRELAAGETYLAHEALSTLRPRQRDERDFVALVDGELRADGYRLVGAFVADREQAVAAAGFRLGSNLAWGHFLYVDDLCTVADARAQGHGGALLRWLLAEACRLGCQQLHLDSGTGAQRFDAHRLYHRHGLAIHSHHFARAVPAPPQTT